MFNIKDQLTREYKWDKQMLKDLFNPTDRVRAIGRTSILIEVFMELAKENPEVKIPIIDHFVHPRAIDNIMSHMSKRIYEVNDILAGGTNERARFYIVDKYYVCFGIKNYPILKEKK